MSRENEVSSSSSFNKETSINIINNDCLVEIFNYLTKFEKIKASMVCRRWAVFLAKNLKINYKLLFKINTKTGALPFLVKFIKTCGSYLNSLEIDFNSTSPDNISFILNEIARNCKNILRINFHFCAKSTVFNFNEDDLQSIFASNFSISYVTLNRLLNISGKSLLKLQPFIIKELSITDCKFTSTNYLISFLSGLKNLEKFKIDCFSPVDMSLKVINALNESNCENIAELSFGLVEYDENETIQLKRLLSKQRKLKVLSLKYLSVDEEFLEFLPKDSLEVLKISTLNNQTNYSFPRFENLKVLHLSKLTVNDGFLKELTKCKNLKDLKLSKITDYSITEAGESYFSEFLKLETFMIMAPKKYIDYILVALTQCKNLKILNISYCRLTNIGVDSLGLISELSDLSLVATNVTDEQLKKLLKNLINLKELNVCLCKKLSEGFIKEIKNNVINWKNNNLISKNFKRILHNPFRN